MGASLADVRRKKEARGRGWGPRAGWPLTKDQPGKVKNRQAQEAFVPQSLPVWKIYHRKQETSLGKG